MSDITDNSGRHGSCLRRKALAEEYLGLQKLKISAGQYPRPPVRRLGRGYRLAMTMRGISPPISRNRVSPSDRFADSHMYAPELETLVTRCLRSELPVSRILSVVRISRQLCWRGILFSSRPPIKM